MGVSIGRISPLHLDNIAKVDQGAGRLDLEGRLGTTEDWQTTAVGFQLAALADDLDETAVPVVFIGDHIGLAHLNGFYRVVDGGVTFDGGTIDPADPIGRPEWKATLVPIQDRSAPRIESILETVLRTNSVSIAGSATDPWHAIPDGSTGYNDQVNQTLFPSLIVPTATGSIRRAIDVTNAPSRRVVAAWRCPPTYWYDGAALIERKWSDSNWLPVIGRDPSLADGDTGWRISNGLVRFSISSTDPTLAQIECYGATGGWQSLVTFRFYAEKFNSPIITAMNQALTSVAVLRNNPAEVRVRIAGSFYQAMGSIIDLRLRRGAPFIEIMWSTPFSSGSKGTPMSLTFVSVSPSWTNLTGGGGRVSTADGNGNKLVQFWPIASDNTARANTWATAIGYELNGFGSGSGMLLDADNLKKQYFAPSAEHVRLLGA